MHARSVKNWFNEMFNARLPKAQKPMIKLFVKERVEGLVKISFLAFKIIFVHGDDHMQNSEYRGS